MTSPGTAPAFDLDALRRAPDVEAPNLVAVDATDRLVLDEAADALAAAGPGEVAVIGDGYGALTLGAIALHGARDVRVHIDPLLGELALTANAERSDRTAGTALVGQYRTFGLVPELVSGARVVLLQLPRGLAELEEIAQLVAAHAHPDVQVVAGGRLKHMTLRMNEVLGRSFDLVAASRARQKSRVLHAQGVTPLVEGGTVYPVRRHSDELDLEIVAHGAAFAGPTLDIGTRYLLTFLGDMPSQARDVVDLGSGTGVLAVVAARTWPQASVLATDQAWSAVASTTATAEANGVADRVRVVRDNALRSQEAGSADLVLCNPPFHSGPILIPDIALRLFDEAGRVLRSGGELWTVFNSRLGHTRELRKRVGPTEIMGENGSFTVTRSVKR